MGWETLAIVGFQAIQGANSMSAAKKQGQAYAREGERQALSVADQTVRTAGTLRTNYLQSGLTLEGGPMDVIAQAFAKGRTDIGRIKENADARSKNVVGAARTKMIQGLAGAAVSAGAASGIGDFAGGFSDGFSAGFSNPDIVGQGLSVGELGTSSTWVPPWQANAPLPWSS